MELVCLSIWSERVYRVTKLVENNFRYYSIRIVGIRITIPLLNYNLLGDFSLLNKVFGRRWC